MNRMLTFIGAVYLLYLKYIRGHVHSKFIHKCCCLGNDTRLKGYGS